MVAELTSTNDWRGPGCGDACQERYLIVPGLLGRQAVAMHDPEAHEQYGRYLAGDLSAANVLESGPLRFDHHNWSITVDGRPISLSPTEMRILCVLAERCGRLVSYDELLQLVWGPEYRGATYIVRSNIGRLRARLGVAGTLIRTRPTQGFLLLHLAPGDPLPALDFYRPTNQDLGIWARNHERCRDCGTTDHPHYGRGICLKCRSRHVSLARSR